MTTGDGPLPPRHDTPLGPKAGPLQALLNEAPAARVEVCRHSEAPITWAPITLMTRRITNQKKTLTGPDLTRPAVTKAA
ncbi:hypothetical protein ACFRIB_51085 [Streptomyces mirabilis]|uniref:hypothetical protein n=1 Tax=Streptomyces mirabilis TaxID=68239 RepID=UPI0036AC8AFD